MGSQKGSVGSTQKKSAEEGALTKFCPPRPLHMLPYSHGVTTAEKVEKALTEPGDYLLIVERESKELILCVRGEDGKVHRVPVQKRASDRQYVIEGERQHHSQGFTNVEGLITYYDVYGLAVKEVKVDKDSKNGTELKLKRPVNKRSDDKPPSDRRRPFRTIKELVHFHGALSEEEACKLLTIDGDYLLREDPAKKGVFLLSVRGGGSFHHQVMERDSVSGGYVLPRDSEDMPIECVSMIDEWVQFHDVYNIPVAGKFKLVRPIEKTKGKS